MKQKEVRQKWKKERERERQRVREQSKREEEKDKKNGIDHILCYEQYYHNNYHRMALNYDGKKFFTNGPWWQT